MNDPADAAAVMSPKSEGLSTPSQFPTECDLVMKGGISSGIVYPLAIVEIAKAFRLRSIGGTSVGAIAAAAAAAAELGRQRRIAGQLRAHDGFAELEKLPSHLSAPANDGHGTKLLAFFKPKAGLRPIFGAVTAALDAPDQQASWVAAKMLLSHYKCAALLGFLVGTLPLWGMRWWSLSHVTVLWLLLLGVVGAALAVLWQAARDVLRDLPANRFGMCSGMPDPGEANPSECLTVWLTDYCNRLSGQRQVQAGALTDIERAKPLTFGDLRAARIDLQVMTTCLTLGRPFRLPLRDDDKVRENKSFLYKEAEFRELFPKEVVDWMVLRERDFRKDEGSSVFDGADFTGYRCMPDPDHLPVSVAVRMSLSFPILLSAMPLYAFDFHKLSREKPTFKGESPERCWFTDGGVGSNFPIHFFDAPLPTRPTFGLDLGQADSESDPRVVFPKDNGDARLPYWRRFDGRGGFPSIAAFLGTVINVAKDWNHEALSHLPGFRDRIGLIRLTKQEGGLNLTMPKERIEWLTAFGREAGIEFVRRFGDSQASHQLPPRAKMNWENHQLVRLRLFLASSAEMLGALKTAVESLAQQPAMTYERFFTGDYGPETYRFTGRHNLSIDPQTGHPATQVGVAKSEFDRLLAVAREIEETVSSSDAATLHPSVGAPKPTPELKLRPRI